jgi:predicted ATPase
MITKIEVDGFKSLSGFELNLNSGLNILVGPNGSGKTNIVLFFEFLSKLTTNQVGNAVSSVGGADQTNTNQI